MRKAMVRTMLALMGALIIPACTEETLIIDSSGSGSGSGGQGFDWFVDAVIGDDTNAGSPSAPFKTITQALSRAVAGQTIKVQPGTYDAANGEVFPLPLPGGIRLIGDEANKGNGPVPTLITGDGPGPSSAYTATVEAVGGLPVGSECVIAGFLVTNTGSGGVATHAAFLSGGRCVVRDCSFLNSSDVGILFISGSGDDFVRDNDIRSNGTGIKFDDGGFDTRVERNIIRDNTVGIEISTPTSLGGSWDFGGGPPGGLGLNELSSNPQNDILMSGTGSHNVHAENNFWDHVPPSGNDFFIVSGTFNLTTTGAMLAPNPTP